MNVPGFTAEFALQGSIRLHLVETGMAELIRGIVPQLILHMNGGDPGGDGSGDSGSGEGGSSGGSGSGEGGSSGGSGSGGDVGGGDDGGQSGSWSCGWDSCECWDFPGSGPDNCSYLLKESGQCDGPGSPNCELTGAGGTLHCTCAHRPRVS